MAAAKAHVDQAAADLEQVTSETREAEDRLVTMSNIRSLDEAITPVMLMTLDDYEEPIALLYEAYAGSMYPPEEGEEEEERNIDRAELIHLLQDFELMGRGAPPEAMCGVFVGVDQTLSLDEFKRCLARAALALVPASVVAQFSEDAGYDAADERLRWMLSRVPALITRTKLPVLDVQRRVHVLAAAEHLQAVLVEGQAPDS